MDLDQLPLQSREQGVGCKTRRSARAAKDAEETGLTELGDDSRKVLHNLGEFSSSYRGSQDDSDSSSDSLAASRGGTLEDVEADDRDIDNSLDHHRRSQATAIPSATVLSSSQPALPSSNESFALAAPDSSQQDHRRKPQVPSEVSDVPSRRRPYYATRPKTRSEEILQELKDMAEVSHGLTAEQAERDKLVARMTKKQIPDALKIAKEHQTALYRRIDQAFARSDRQDELTSELLEMVAGTATGQTGTGDEEDERGEEMPKHSDGHSDNYMGE
ncbi:hypothetical protein HBH64_090230 [Parastagonospora nodorum]|nr:hypothetical protein HBH52_122430 [Parastagonospora nodorum]KAH4211442.1 hypothetical protein HBI95_056660 [Parastagonospora nodorum]KAH4288124.1 hypothetical protein HBI01_224090 [Parastagonospora nodorum]KAH4304663.1 hypothetical protein HBI02_123070 [Parastagonospora nodorum]KAH4323738.1 hypothetical protein HBI00_177840 [Parastagonospora nodorum]